MNMQIVSGMRMSSIALFLILILGSCGNSYNKKIENSAQDTTETDRYVDAAANREIEAVNAANETSTTNSNTKSYGTSVATAKLEANKTAKAETGKEKPTAGHLPSALVIPSKSVDEQTETTASIQPQSASRAAPATEKPKAVMAPQAAKGNAKSATDNWIVPEKNNNKSNPMIADAESLRIGKSLYLKHCASCHGKKGRGEGSKAAQLDNPGDFTLATFQQQTDGALFYKINTGKGAMPGFKKKIPYEDEIWSIVHYIRTLQ